MSRKNSIPLFKADELNIEPIERAHTIPSHWYYDPDIFTFEIEHLFARQWQYLCHEDQIPEAGDMYTTEIAHNPVLVFRTARGEIRSFFNVCKHRGGPLAIKKGTSTVLQCQYHGWTYRDDGSLRGIPDWNLVELFDEKDFGLDPFEIAVWNGLIFGRVSKEKLELEDLLDGIQERIAPLDPATLPHHSDEVYEIECNWKVYVDNFLEGYHIPIVHPELANLLDYRNYRTETHTHYSLQHSPLQGDSNLYKKEDGEACYYFVFPNMMLNILPDRIQVNLVTPLSPTRCKVLFSYFYGEVDARVIREDIAASHEIQMEDIEICEAVQRGLGSKAYHQGRFSVKRETGVHHFQSLLKSYLKEAQKST